MHDWTEILVKIFQFILLPLVILLYKEIRGLNSKINIIELRMERVAPSDKMQEVDKKLGIFEAAYHSSVRQIGDDLEDIKKSLTAPLRRVDNLDDRLLGVEKQHHASQATMNHIQTDVKDIQNSIRELGRAKS